MAFCSRTSAPNYRFFERWLDDFFLEKELNSTFLRKEISQIEDMELGQAARTDEKQSGISLESPFQPINPLGNHKSRQFST